MKINSLPIQYLLRQNIDTVRWNACIENAANGLPYALSWYLDIVANKKWDALVLGDYEAVMPLPFNRKRILFRQIYQPFFAQQLGIFSRQELTEKEVATWLEHIPKPFRRIALHLNEGNPPPTLSGFSFVPKKNLLLSLQNDVETIQKGYSKSLRKRLRQAEEHGLHFGEPIGPKELAMFYQRNIGGKIEVLKDAHYQTVTGLMEAAIERKKGRILSVYNAQNELAAAGFFLFGNGRTINLIGASSETGKAQFAMHYLLNEIIKNKAGSDEVFDFEGSNIPSIAAFFESYGAVERGYLLVKR